MRLKKIKRSLTSACVAYRGLKEVYTPLITASESISEAIRAAEENIAKKKHHQISLNHYLSVGNKGIKAPLLFTSKHRN
jgi:hypothetical protein